MTIGHDFILSEVMRDLFYEYWKNKPISKKELMAWRANSLIKGNYAKPDKIVESLGFKWYIDDNIPDNVAYVFDDKMIKDFIKKYKKKKS